MEECAVHSVVVIFSMDSNSLILKYIPNVCEIISQKFPHINFNFLINLQAEKLVNLFWFEIKGDPTATSGSCNGIINNLK